MMQAELIAPCGMNCNICLGYLRDKNKCPGCRNLDKKHPVTRWCKKIRGCATLKKMNARFCFSCDSIPCQRLKNLDKRYRTRYGMSMLENLAYVKRFGIRKFLKKEVKKWTCGKCGGTICVHRGYCFTCGAKKWTIPHPQTQR